MAKDKIQFSRPTPPALLPVIEDKYQESQEEPQTSASRITQEIGEDFYSKRESRCKTKIREAFLKALGNNEEVMINQVKMKEEVGLSHATWVRYVKELREDEFYLIRQHDGTIVGRRKK